MAICEYCKWEMSDLTTDTCIKQDIKYPNGAIFAQIPFHPVNSTRRCSDCNIAPGGYHHPGCDEEECPQHWDMDNYAAQLISCGCLSLPEKEEVEEEGEPEPPADEQIAQLREEVQKERQKRHEMQRDIDLTVQNMHADFEAQKAHAQYLNGILMQIALMVQPAGKIDFNSLVWILEERLQ